MAANNQLAPDKTIEYIQHIKYQVGREMRGNIMELKGLIAERSLWPIMSTSRIRRHTVSGAQWGALTKGLRRLPALFGGAVLTLLPNFTHAEVELKQFHGLWAISDQDCQDPDGPNYKTYIDSSSFDQYENHCKIGNTFVEKNVQGGKDKLKLNLSCKHEGEDITQTVWLTPMPADKVLIEQGKNWNLYQKCNFKLPEEPKPPGTVSPTGPEGISCSHPDVLDLLTKIVKDSGIIVHMKSVQDKKTGFTLQLLPVINYDGILTLRRTENGRGFQCMGIAHVDYDDPLSKQTIQYFLTISKNSKHPQDRKLHERFVNISKDKTIKWIAQLSDDGKTVHVNLE